MKGKALWPFIPAWLDEADLSAAEFRLLCHLWRWAGQSAETWRSAKKLEEALKISKPYRKRLLASLRAKGFLIVTNGHRGKSNHYSLRVPKGLPADTPNELKGDTEEHPNDRKGAPSRYPNQGERGIPQYPKGLPTDTPREPSIGTPQSGNSKKGEWRSRIGKLFNRRATTSWDKAETNAFESWWKNQRSNPDLEADFEAIEQFRSEYSSYQGSAFVPHPRKTISSLVNNWASEVTKAKEHLPTLTNKLNSNASNPDKYASGF